MFILDGVPYDVLVTNLEQKGEILSSDKSGRLQNGDMYIDPIGTFYNYTVKIQRRPGVSLALYDELFLSLTNPHSEHTLTVPHGQGEMTFRAYISSASRALIRQYNGANYWGEIALEFVSMTPQRR